MIAHAQELRLLTDIEVVTKILLIGSIIQTIDEILQQFTCTIGCNFMADLNASFAKKLSAMIRGMEYKGEVIQTECFLVVVTSYQII